MIAYFQNLSNLLNIEKEEDKAQYLAISQQATVSERRANGITWYPIAIRGSELGIGDYLTIEFERTTHQDLPHQFRFGMPVEFFSNHNASQDKINGTITHQSGNKIRVNILIEELPEWSNDGKLGINVLFDDNSYDEMQTALKNADALADKPEGKTIRTLISNEKISFNENIKTFIPEKFNESQKKSIQNILSANELAIIHGPPGTGKTTTIVEAIKQLVQLNHQQILVVAPSNTAVDLLSEKLHNEGMNVVRIGNPAKISQRLFELTLDYQVAHHETNKETKRLKKQAQEYKQMAHKYKRSFGKSERDQRKLLFEEAHKIMKEVGKTENYITEKIFDRAQIITATLVGSNNYLVKNRTYNTVVIDEAGQSIEPACWIPILKAQKIVMAGDHYQLPPTIKSEEASRKGLNQTLFEKCIELHPEAVTMLNLQYRMHNDIMQYSSQIFYKNQLKADHSVANKTLYSQDQAFTFIDTAGCSFDEKIEGTSSTNPTEATFLVKQLIILVETLEKNQITNQTFAIISPYKQQIKIIDEIVQAENSLKKILPFISVNTIDSFQGQERDIVLISMTRSNNEGKIGFLADTRRMNVAMTRAKKKLIVIGDSSTIATHPFYEKMIHYSEQINSYKSAWEYIN